MCVLTNIENKHLMWNVMRCIAGAWSSHSNLLVRDLSIGVSGKAEPTHEGEALKPLMFRALSSLNRMSRLSTDQCWRK